MSTAKPFSAPAEGAAFVIPFGKPAPLFVTGIWRSGTSLLYALLNQHPKIALLYEGDLPLFPSLYCKPDELAARWNFWNSALDRHGIPTDCFAASESSLAALEVYDAHRRSRAATIGGEKSPSFYEHLPYLARLYPEASFIVIWRDPMKICQSIQAAQNNGSWFSRRGIMLRALLGSELLKRGVDSARARGVRVHEITYSELTRDTERVMREICTFLGISYWPSMATLAGSDRSAIYEGQHHSAVKSNEIRPKSTTAISLPSKLREKVGRYTYGWRQKYPVTWPLLDETALSGDHGPGLAERIRDRFMFNCYRCLDAAVMRLYSVAPLSLLRSYRQAKTKLRREPHAA